MDTGTTQIASSETKNVLTTTQCLCHKHFRFTNRDQLQTRRGPKLSQQKAPEDNSTCGVHQKLIIGSLLFLIYINNDLSNCLNVGTPRMYVDDTNVTFSVATIPDLESQINRDLKYIDRWLKANKLSLNVTKTEFMVVSSSIVNYGSRQKLQSLNDYIMNIHIDGVPRNQSNESKSLRLIIDENLSWKAHSHEI